MTPVESDLAERLRSMARLARPTAHELRGALSSVHIHLELLNASLDAHDAAGRERRDRCLRVLKEECGRVRRLADAFLALAVLPSGAREVDLSALVGDVVAAARPFATERRVRLEAAPMPTLVRRLAEPEACRQRVLDGLLDELAEASPGAAMHLAMTPDGQHVEIAGAAGESRRVALLAGEGPGDA